MNRRHFLSLSASLAGLSLLDIDIRSALAAPQPPKAPLFANTIVFAQRQTLVFLSPDGKTVREVPVALPEGAIIEFVSASESGQLIAFSVQNAIYTVKSDGSELRVLSPRDNDERSHPALSPDGTLVACGHDHINHPLVVLDAQGEPRSFGDSTLETSTVRFARDGRSLFFYAKAVLFQIPLEGGEAKRISRHTYIEEFDPGPDGRLVGTIAYGNDAVNLNLIDPKDGTEAIPQRLDLEGHNFFSPTWSPDGKSIAYSTRGRNGGRYADGVFVVTLSDLNVRQISDRHLNPTSGLTWR